MDYRFVIIFLVIICCAVMAIMIIRAIQYEIGLNRIRSREAVSELRKFQLDEYRAQLTAVRDQMQDRLEKRIRDAALSQEWAELRYEALSGIAIVDVVLHEKRETCRKTGVSCEYQVQPVPDNILQEKYWPSLIGNLLNNAIEAARKCPEENRWIRLSTAQRANQWTLKVENSKSVSEHPLANAMATTKADRKNHGIGSKVIDRIVKEANGYIKRADDGNVFTVFVALPSGDADD